MEIFVDCDLMDIYKACQLGSLDRIEEIIKNENSKKKQEEKRNGNLKKIILF